MIRCKLSAHAVHVVGGHDVHIKTDHTHLGSERSLDTVVRAVSAAILPVWVDFTSLKGLPCAPGPATTRRGMLVTNSNG